MKHLLRVLLTALALAVAASAQAAPVPYGRVIAADSRSQAKSKDPGSALTFEMMADDEAALLDALHAIGCPCLVICGDHDLISIEHTVKIFQNIPKAALWVVPSSGHATLIQHADEFNKKVDEFFSTPTSRGKSKP